MLAREFGWNDAFSLDPNDEIVGQIADIAKRKDIRIDVFRAIGTLRQTNPDFLQPVLHDTRI